MKILIIDDEPNCCDDLGKFLSRIDHEITKAYSAKEAIQKIKEDNFELIICDVNMPEINGIEFVTKVKERKIKSYIILISGLSEVAESINAIDLGIYDFITKPVDLNKLVNLIDKIEEINKSKEYMNYSLANILQILDEKDTIDLSKIDISFLNIFKNKNIDDICVFSEKMTSIFKKLEKLHQYQDIPVLIEGVTGTGKELVSKFIHFEGLNNKEPFVAVNCAAINKEMFEAELFGYEKGAFTGARPEGREGFIKLAENGTLLLDEITELNPDTQSKLLRVLQEKEYYKVGGSNKEIANTRFIFSTNVDLEDLVKKRLFREDLYFRLNMCKIKIPALKNRREEIIPLTVYFIKIFNKKFNKNIKKIESIALKRIYQYDWPGNVRELKNVLVQSIIFNETDIIKLNDLKFQYASDIENLNSSNYKNENNNKMSIININLPEDSFNLEEHIDSIIKQALKKFNGNKTKAAKYLGISRMQLYNRYKE